MSSLQEQELLRSALNEYLYHSLLSNPDGAVEATANGLKPKHPINPEILRNASQKFFSYLMEEIMGVKEKVKVEINREGQPVITFPSILINSSGESKLDYTNIDVADITPEVIDRVKNKLYGSPIC